jgi:hypothetical protein
MADKPEYHFKFQIADATTGEIIECDWCSLSYADPESVVNLHVSQMLRNWRNFARAEYERENYQVPA